MKVAIERKATHLVQFQKANVMKAEMKKAISEHPEIERYLKEIPESLWETLVPSEAGDLGGFASMIKALRIREKEREYIIELRRKYGLLFRPNATIDETIKRVRLIRWQRKMRMEKQGLDIGAEDTPADRVDPDEELI